MGETPKAIECYEQNLAITRETGDKRGEAVTLFNLSLILNHLGERKQALTNAEAALRILEEIESPSAEKVRQQLAEWRGAPRQ